MNTKRICWRLWPTTDDGLLMAVSVQELLRAARDLPGDSAVRDGEILLGHCLDKPRSWLYTWPEVEVSPRVVEQFNTLLKRRRAGEPVAYLIGQREFWSLTLQVNEHTLIPRPETETLVEWALELDLPGEAAVLDLGTGAGAIALAVASERQRWRVTALDASPEALLVARSNNESCQLPALEWLHSNWFENLRGRRFHLLLSNPPYIENSDVHLIQGDVRFEPRSALVADEEGLADLRRIIASASAHLIEDGWLLLEHGFEQGEATRALLRGAGFSSVKTRSDLDGRQRVSGGQRQC